MNLVIANATSDKFGSEDVSSLVVQLQSSAAQVHLSGVPPLSNISSHVQLLTGLSPEWTGVYDEFKVEDYQVRPTKVLVETEEQFLWKVVETMGKSSTQVKGVLPAYLTDLVYLEIQTSYDLEALYDIPDEEAVKVLILPEPSSQRSRGININDFFEVKGLLERTDDGNIHWEETLAYHVGHGQIWINLLGREPNGVVSPGKEYSEVREALVRILTEQLLTTETNIPVVASVRRKEDIYNTDGRFFVNAPDLVVTFLPGYSPSPQSIQLGFGPAGQEFHVVERYSCPVKRYLMFVWGNSIKSKHSSVGRLVDLVPTALYVLDLPIPRMLSGRIIKEIFEPTFWDKVRPRYQAESELTPEEEALLIDRLETLGYIE
jgi:predicted AlkP superfamily phosphohydrolase/phosphomutase